MRSEARAEALLGDSGPLEASVRKVEAELPFAPDEEFELAVTWDIDGSLVEPERDFLFYQYDFRLESQPAGDFAINLEIDVWCDVEPEIKVTARDIEAFGEVHASRAGFELARTVVRDLTTHAGWAPLDLPVELGRAWASAGFDPEQAPWWRAMGFDAATAQPWREAGFGADDAADWVIAGADVDEAVHYENAVAGFEMLDHQDAVRYFREGIDPEDSKRDAEERQREYKLEELGIDPDEHTEVVPVIIDLGN